MAYSDVFIDDTRLQDLGIIVRLNSDEPALPSLTNSNDVVPGRHGAFDFGGWFEPRVFKLDCVFQRQSYAELKQSIRALNRLLLDDYGVPRTFRLRFGDEPNVYYNARLTSDIPVERTAGLGMITLELTAYDPFAYSVVMNDEVVWGSEQIDFTATYLMGDTGDWATVIQGNTTQILKPYVYGFAVRPVITIVGSATSITISANGKSFGFDSFPESTIIVDGENYRVTNNGLSYFREMTGDFIELLPGENDVMISGDGLNIIIKIQFRDKYL